MLTGSPGEHVPLVLSSTVTSVVIIRRCFYWRNIYAHTAYSDDHRGNHFPLPAFLLPFCSICSPSIFLFRPYCMKLYHLRQNPNKLLFFIWRKHYTHTAYSMITEAISPTCCLPTSIYSSCPPSIFLLQWHDIKLYHLRKDTNKPTFGVRHETLSFETKHEQANHQRQFRLHMLYIWNL